MFGAGMQKSMMLVVPPAIPLAGPVSKSSALTVPMSGRCLVTCGSMKPGSTRRPAGAISVSPLPFRSAVPMPVIVRPSTLTSAVNRSPAFTTVPPRITMPIARPLSALVLDEPHPGLRRVHVFVRFEDHVVVVEPRGERRHAPGRIADLDPARGHGAARPRMRPDLRAQEPLPARLGPEEWRADEQCRELVLGPGPELVAPEHDHVQH